MSRDERHALVHALVAGLRELSPTSAASEAFRVIAIDLDPPFLVHGVAMNLAEALSGTAAGEELRRMRSDAAEAREEHRRRLALDGPEAVEERKRVKRAARAVAHARRQQEARERNRERLEMLESLAQLAPADRLVRFATDPALVLDSVPPELIPTEPGMLLGMEESLVPRLLARIDRRRGAWGRLRSVLHGRADDGLE